MNPRPFLRIIYPMSGKGLNQELRLTLEGSNLVDESVVEFEGVEVPSKPVKSTMLRETMYNPVYTQLEVNRAGLASSTAMAVTG